MLFRSILPLYVYKNQITADGLPLSRLEATDRLDWYGSMLALHYTEKDMKLPQFRPSPPGGLSS